MNKPFTKSERAVLKCLEEHSSHDENCLPSGFIATLTDLSLLQARRAVKSLQRRGYAELVRGIFRDDGSLAGSGYCCTPEGRTTSRSMSSHDRGAENG